MDNSNNEEIIDENVGEKLESNKEEDEKKLKKIIRRSIIITIIVSLLFFNFLMRTINVCI